MADYPIFNWYFADCSCLIVVTLVTMTILGFGGTRYIRHMRTVPPHSSEGTQTDFPSEPREPPAPSSELVTLG